MLLEETVNGVIVPNRTDPGERLSSDLVGLLIRPVDLVRIERFSS